MRLKSWCKLVAGALLATMVVGAASDADAKRVRWKVHSGFGSKLFVIGTGPYNVSNSLKAMSNGEIDLKIFEPGALVPGIAYYDPVSSGSIDAAWGTPGFNVNKNFAYAFFSSVPFGPNGGEYLAWMRYGGGVQMADEMYGRDGIKFYICNIIPPETSGWFRKEINSVADLKGLKMRFFGLGAKVMEKFGVSTQLLAAGDIYPALELGSIDATEFSLAAIDKDLGFYQVAKHNYFPGWHQQATIGELLVNKAKHDELDDSQKAMLKAACDQQTLQGFVEGEAGQFEAMLFHKEKGVQIHRWSDEMIATFEKAWLEVIQAEIKNSEDAKKIWASYSKFRDDYAIWREHGYLR